MWLIIPYTEHRVSICIKTITKTGKNFPIHLIKRILLLQVISLQHKINSDTNISETF